LRRLLRRRRRWRARRRVRPRVLGGGSVVCRRALVAMPGVEHWAKAPHAVLQLATCVPAQSADRQHSPCHSLTRSILISTRGKKHRRCDPVRTSSPTSGSLIGSAGLTCQLGRSARCVAGVQSHEDERNQGQHRHSHRDREQEQALCADHRSLKWASGGGRFLSEAKGMTQVDGKGPFRVRLCDEPCSAEHG